jgi:hypothetical protein
VNDIWFHDRLSFQWRNGLGCQFALTPCPILKQGIPDQDAIKAADGGHGQSPFGD